ncbi:MAG: prolipoprotein diacylglyceryl transferase [Candidatus Omnitrophota bacterium]
MYRIIFQIGPFTLYSYGLFVAIGFLLSTILILKDSKRFGIPANDVFDCLIAILIGGLLGGRLLFVFINWGYYSRHLLRAFMFYEGGLAFQGALVAAILAGAVVMRIKKLPFWKTADLIAPYVALGQALGRIGCFLNGCCYGKVVESGIAVTFPQETVMRVPTQLYSSLVLLFIFVILIALSRKRPFDGYVFTAYIILYSIFRFFMDFARGDDLALLYEIKLSQGIAIGMFACGVVMYVFLRKRNLT